MVRLLHAIIGEDGRMIDRGRELQLPAAREEMLVRGGFARKIPAMENPEFAEAAAPMFADGSDAGTAPEGAAPDPEGIKAHAAETAGGAAAPEGAAPASEGTKAPAAETAEGAAAPEGGTAVEEPAGPFAMEAGEKPLGRKAK